MNPSPPETDSTLGNSQEPSEQKEATEENVPVRLVESRHWLVEGALIFSTFGIYSAFWMPFRVAELRKLSNTQFQPWLWIFVPFIFLAQLIALPKFTTEVHKLEGLHGRPVRTAASNAWVILIAVSTFYFNLSNRFEVLFIYDIAALALFSLLVALFDRRFTLLKEAIPNAHLTKRNIYFHLFDGLIIALFLPLVIWVTYDYTYKEFFLKPLATLDRNEQFIPENNGYTLTSTRDGWVEVEVGTFSDGSAEYEFKGPLADMHFMIFHYEKDYTLDDATYWRVGTMQDELIVEDCEQNRYFEGPKSSVVAFAYCEGLSGAMSGILVIKVIQTTNGIFEIYGYFSSVKQTYKDEKKDFIEMAKSFQVQP